MSALGFWSLDSSGTIRTVGGRVVLLVTLLLCPAVASAQLIARDDTHVKNASASNFRDADRLIVGDFGKYTSFIRFDLSMLPIEVTGNEIQKATLRLFIGAGGPRRLVRCQPRAGRLERGDAVVRYGRRPRGQRRGHRSGGSRARERIPPRGSDRPGEGVGRRHAAKRRRRVGADWRRQSRIRQQGGQRHQSRSASRNRAVATRDGKRWRDERHRRQSTPGATPTTTPHISLGTVPVALGGTGLTTSGAAGSLLRSDGSAWTSAPLSAPDIPPGSAFYIRNAISPQPATASTSPASARRTFSTPRRSSVLAATAF